jgi:hypothetical protein
MCTVEVRTVQGQSPARQTSRVRPPSAAAHLLLTGTGLLYRTGFWNEQTALLTFLGTHGRGTHSLTRAPLMLRPPRHFSGSAYDTTYAPYTLGLDLDVVVGVQPADELSLLLLTAK